MQQLLRTEDIQAALAEIRQIPGRQAVNPLFSFFYSTDEMLRWRAITAMGVVVGQLADSHMESARVIMRRLMWNLNDESGGIGWGSPEAMGEITAVHPMLAMEFHRILISYVDPSGNYLEHPGLQRGAVWGMGRLAHARPDLAQPAAGLLPAFFNASDPYLRRHGHMGRRADTHQPITPLGAGAPVRPCALAPVPSIDTHSSHRGRTGRSSACSEKNALMDQTMLPFDNLENSPMQ